MPRVKPATVVEAAVDEATKKVAGAVGADSIPDAGATSEAEGSSDAGSAGVKEVKEEEEEKEDKQLKRALRKKGMIMTTPIQREAILVRDFLRPFFYFTAPIFFISLLFHACELG
jgi:hypothetical protein